MSKFAQRVLAFFDNLSIPNLIRLFLFLFLLLAIPVTILAIVTTRGNRSLASGWSISLSVVCDYSTKTAYLYRTVTIQAGYDKGYMNFYANGNLYTQSYDTYPGHTNVREGSAGRSGNSIYATLHSGSAEGPLQATSNTVTTPDCSTPPCTSQCSSGAKQCASGNSFQTCGNYDADSCLEWSSATPCSSGQTCSGGNCITSGGGTSDGGTSDGGTSGGGTSGGRKISGGSSGTGTNLLENLQLEIFIPYLVGKIKVKADLGGTSKEIEVSPAAKSYPLDLKGANLSFNKEYNLVITSSTTLVRKVKFTPNSASFNLNVGDLILGDINQDNRIDSYDQSKLMDSIADQTSLGDLNADSVANSIDWATLLTNFGKRGD